MKKIFIRLGILVTVLFAFVACEVEELEGFDEKNAEQNLMSKGLSADGYVNFADNTRLTTLWMREDHEPWHRGDAEIYAHIIGLDNNKQPLISTVRLPFANHDRTMYYIDTKLIDWDANRYAGGLVSIVFMEADNASPIQEPIFATTYSAGRFLNTPIPQALSIVTNDFVEAEGIGYATVEDGIIYEGADDIVDVFYNISRYQDYEVIGGAVGGSRDNVFVTLKRRF